MKLKFTAAISILIALAMITIGCPGGDKDDEYTGPLLAKVNDSVITPEDFIISMQLLYFPSERPKYSTPEGKEAFLKLLTAMELFYQEGKRQGIEQDPMIERAVENFRRYLIYHILITQNIDSESITNFYQRNFFHVAVIKVSKPKGADDAAISKLRKKAEKLLADLKGGADFGKTAQKHSDHPTRENGGDPGPITFTGDWPAEVVRAAGTLKGVGDLSPVVEARDGFYILKLLEPYGKLNLAGLTDDRQLFIYNSLLQQNFKNYASQLQLMADVKLYPEALREINLEAPMEGGKRTVPSLPPPGVPAIDRGASNPATP